MSQQVTMSKVDSVKVNEPEREVDDQKIKMPQRNLQNNSGDSTEKVPQSNVDNLIPVVKQPPKLQTGPSNPNFDLSEAATSGLSSS